MTDMTMKCGKCGELIRANPADAGKTGSCPACGTPVVVDAGGGSPPPFVLPQPPAVPQPVQPSGHAIASLVLGILSIMPGTFFGGIVMGILAIVFSMMATKRIKAEPRSVNGQGLATAGLVTGIVGLSLSLMIILLFGAIASIGLTFLAAMMKAMAAGVPR
jgi:hypothetical protein